MHWALGKPSFCSAGTLALRGTAFLPAVVESEPRIIASGRSPGLRLEPVRLAGDNWNISGSPPPSQPSVAEEGQNAGAGRRSGP